MKNTGGINRIMENRCEYTPDDMLDMGKRYAAVFKLGIAAFFAALIEGIMCFFFLAYMLVESPSPDIEKTTDILLVALIVVGIVILVLFIEIMLNIFKMARYNKGYKTSGILLIVSIIMLACIFKMTDMGAGTINSVLLIASASLFLIFFTRTSERTIEPASSKLREIWKAYRITVIVCAILFATINVLYPILTPDVETITSMSQAIIGLIVTLVRGALSLAILGVVFIWNPVLLKMSSDAFIKASYDKARKIKEASSEEGS